MKRLKKFIDALFLKLGYMRIPSPHCIVIKEERFEWEEFRCEVDINPFEMQQVRHPDPEEMLRRKIVEEFRKGLLNHLGFYRKNYDSRTIYGASIFIGKKKK